MLLHQVMLAPAQAPHGFVATDVTCRYVSLYAGLLGLPWQHSAGLPYTAVEKDCTFAPACIPC
jgi:hypothetical protein